MTAGHQANALGSIRIEKFKLSVRWQYGSGLPFSESLGFDEFLLLDGPTDVTSEAGATRVLYGPAIPGQTPRLSPFWMYRSNAPSDLGDHASATLQVAVTNAYDRNNVFYVDLFTLRRGGSASVHPVGRNQDRIQVIPYARLFGLIAVAAMLLVGAGCDDTVTAVLESNRQITMFATLDMNADTQFVRIIPIRETINEFVDPTQYAVKSIDIDNGTEVQWQDSLIEFSNGSQGIVFFARAAPFPGAHLQDRSIRRQ